MGNSNRKISVKSTWNMIRNKREEKKEYDKICGKGIPFKINFFLWKVWKGRVVTDDNLKTMRIPIVSRC